jgi:hypothetical protein
MSHLVVVMAPGTCSAAHSAQILRRGSAARATRNTQATRARRAMTLHDEWQHGVGAACAVQYGHGDEESICGRDERAHFGSLPLLNRYLCAVIVFESFSLFFPV